MKSEKYNKKLKLFRHWDYSISKNIEESGRVFPKIYYLLIHGMSHLIWLSIRSNNRHRKELTLINLAKDLCSSSLTNDINTKVEDINWENENHKIQRDFDSHTDCSMQVLIIVNKARLWTWWCQKQKYKDFTQRQRELWRLQSWP